RLQRHARHRRNGRQSLAAKAKSIDIEQVFRVLDFGSCVALKGEQRVITHHATAIVDYLKKLLAAAFDLNPNPSGAGVNGVFQQLFQNRCRTLHHLSGGDFVGYVFGKNVDPAHKLSLTTKDTKEHKIT